MRRIYLDYAATTPVDSRVFEAMRPYFTAHFGNADSAHSAGREAGAAVDEARRRIAGAVNAAKNEIYFTSGGTEANNWAIRCAQNKDKKRRRILVSAIEHPSVIGAAKQAADAGFTVEYIPVCPGGRVSAEAYADMLGSDVALVSIMHVNNETGAVQSIKDCADAAHRCGALFHTDAVQALAGESVDVKETGVDLMTISAHKIYGPKGIGALYIRNAVGMDALIAGGHQERGVRGGTTNVPAAIGFAEALKISETVKGAEHERLSALCARLSDNIMPRLSGVQINGDRAVCCPGIINLCFDGVKGSQLMQKLDTEGVACSAGAACAAGSARPSYVLRAMGLSGERADSSLRFSFGRFTAAEDIDIAAEKIISCVKALRQIK